MNSKDRLDYLLGKALAGDLDPSETEELQRALAANPKAADAVIRDARFGAFLTLALEEGAQAERFERALRARHRASSQNADFIRELHRRAARPKRAGVPAWTLVAAAAVIVVLAGVYLLAPTDPIDPPPAFVQQPPDAEPIKPAAPERIVPPQGPRKRTPAGARPGMPQPPEPPLPVMIPPPKPEPEPAPAPRPERPKPAVPRETRVAAATVDRAFGRGFIVDGGDRLPLRKGTIVREGQGLQTFGARSRVEISFGDESKIQLHGNTHVRDIRIGEGKHLAVDRGTLSADIAKQERTKPMILDTPRGEVKILGTSLRLRVDRAQTRLEVMDGRVRLTRKKDKKFIYVETGRFAVASDKAPLKSEVLVLTRAFQNGSHPFSDYGGGRDSLIFEKQPDRNYGAAAQIEVGGKQMGILLRWNLSQIPRGSKIREASVNLMPSIPFPAGEPFQLFELKRPWVEGEATWREYAQGKRWQRSGATGPADRGARVLGVLQPTDGRAVRVRLNAAGLALVQSWIRNPEKNHGFLISGDGAHRAAGFASGESPAHGERPWLTLTYVPGKR